MHHATLKEEEDRKHGGRSEFRVSTKADDPKEAGKGNLVRGECRGNQDLHLAIGRA